MTFVIGGYFKEGIKKGNKRFIRSLPVGNYKLIKALSPCGRITGAYPFIELESVLEA